MNKTYIALLLLFAALFNGCTSLDRVNPTDPAAGSKYVGMHYLGSIGEFSKLDDFMVMNDSIWCVDSITEKVYKYLINGDLDYSFDNGGITAPTGICSDGTYFYVADNDMIFRNIKRFDPSNVSSTATVQLLTNPSSYLFIKCAASVSYIFAATATDVYRFDNSNNVLPSFLCGGFTSISAIKYNSAAGELVIADKGTKTISFYNSSGTLIRQYPFTFDIVGFGIKDNYLYVPCSLGLKQYFYDSGTLVKTFADFGEGSGKITAAGACATYGNYVLVGTGTVIKYFGP